MPGRILFRLLNHSAEPVVLQDVWPQLLSAEAIGGQSICQWFLTLYHYGCNRSRAWPSRVTVHKA